MTHRRWYSSTASGTALAFELRVFYRDVLKRTLLTHELNKAINRRFAEHGIEIAFPQRDIRIRTLDSGVVLGSGKTG